MKFTLLISLYYKEKSEYLHQCLQSIYDNTYQPDQVVVVYDGPIGDDLERVIDQFSALLPMEIVRLPQNVGLGAALNRGLEYCRNNTVLRMDTDDVCLPERFALQMAFLENNPQVALLGGAIQEFDESLVVSRGIRFSVSNHIEIEAYCKKRNPFNHMTVAFKKNVIESVGGYQHHFLMEDYNLWLRVIASGYQTHNLKDILVNVRAGNNMISRRKGFDYIKSEIKLAKFKRELKIDNIIGIMNCAIIRIVPRILPTSFLDLVYRMLRK